MDLEKAYSKIDNLCCLNSTVMQTIRSCIEQHLNIDPAEIDFFKAYKETNGDEDFCKDLDEMVEALETIKKLVDLQKEIGCPLDIALKIRSRDIHFIYDENGDRFFINSGEIFQSQFSAYRRIYHSETDFDFVDKVFKWADYGKTWWIKQDRSE